jgi:hypothetical protein
LTDIPILGQTTSTPLHTDLTDEQKQALAKMAEDNPPTAEEKGTRVTTAFLVVVGKDGAVVADANLAIAFDLVLDRGAIFDDIYGAASVVQKDIQAMETAQRTQQQMIMAGAAMQRQAEEARLRAALKM